MIKHTTGIRRRANGELCYVRDFDGSTWTYFIPILLWLKN
jgi:hypothetical protein